MGPARRLLIIEDDTELREGMRGVLTESGYRVAAHGDGKSALEAVEREMFDLAVVDLLLPDIDGFELVRRLRKLRPRMPLVIVTGRGSLADRVAGLDSGADDYVVKPFEMRELEARIRAQLRAHDGLFGAEVQMGPLRWVAGEPRIWLDGTSVDLTPGELALLEALLSKPGRPVSKAVIATRISHGPTRASDAAIELCVHRLRRRLEPHGLEIRTLRGFGYLLSGVDG